MRARAMRCDATRPRRRHGSAGARAVVAVCVTFFVHMPSHRQYRAFTDCAVGFQIIFGVTRHVSTAACYSRVEGYDSASPCFATEGARGARTRLSCRLPTRRALMPMALLLAQTRLSFTPMSNIAYYRVPVTDHSFFPSPHSSLSIYIYYPPYLPSVLLSLLLAFLLSFPLINLSSSFPTLPPFSIH